MVELFWNIKLKLTAMLREVKWNISIRKYDMQSLKESISILSRIFVIHTIIITSDIAKFLGFIKNMIIQKIIFIPLLFMTLLFGIYLSFINGKPKEEFFNEKIFPKLYYDTAIEIYDSKKRFAGTLSNPQSSTLNSSLFIENVPSLFWSLLVEKYDPNLTFDNNATSFYQALFENPFYYNGIDISAPLTESKRLLTHFVEEGNLELKPMRTLTQQLINIFIKKHPFDKPMNGIERLEMAKTFYHELKANNGADFKSWLFSLKDFFIVDGKGYGLRDCSEIFFGKSLDDLSKAQEVILVAMYANSYNSNQSLKEQIKAWREIKNEAIEIVNSSKIIKEHYKIVSEIKKMGLPKLPYFPDSLMEVVGQITSKNREQFSSLPTRSDALLGSTKAVVRQELDKVFKAYSISPKSKLITKIVINFQLNKNFYFNHYLKSKIESLNLSNIWVSVVNDKGNIIRLYQKDSVHQQPPKIGNIGKIFSTLLFVDRGDKFYTKYCNKEEKSEIPTERGYKKCSSSAWIDARRLFASDKMLPLYDGFIKKRERDRRGDNIYYEPIYINKIEAIYQNLSLVSLENNEPRVDLGAGKLEMTPLDVQTAIHKISELLYNPNHIFYGSKLIKSLYFHDIDKNSVEPKLKLLSFESPEQITPTFANFFTKEKRVNLQTIFKSTIYKNYGSLQWLKNYMSVKFVFAQESHKNGIHWLVGLFKKSNRYYSFTIYVEDKVSDNQTVKNSIKNILEETIKSINSERAMKYEYMKHVFKD